MAMRCRLPAPATALPVILALAGCAPVLDRPDPPVRIIEPRLVVLPVGTRPEPAPGECWRRETLPALVETVTQQTALGQAGGGFRTETRQRIVRERESLWLQVPCPDLVDATLIEALQRALAARGFHVGPVTGVMDAATRDALRRFQAPLGLDSGTLSLAAAQMLGLVPVTLARGRPDG